MTAQVEFIPNGQWSVKDLDTLILALETRVKAKEVMHAKEAAAFIGISLRKLYEIPKEVFPFHEVPGLKGRLYLRSELIEKVRRF